jgi:hypothetical protein
MDLLAGAGAQPVILLVFGSIGLTLALSYCRDRARGPVTGMARIARHLSRMPVGTIATVTAAGVVNFGFLPGILVWLGLTAPITPSFLLARPRDSRRRLRLTPRLEVRPYSHATIHASPSGRLPS